MIKYIIGNPRSYRADCGKGKVLLDGSTYIDNFSFQPIAWRFFSACLWLDKENGVVRNWCEIFFVDENNCIGCISFHGYSVENLIKLQTKLFYQDASWEDGEISLNFVKKTTKSGETYFIVDFSFSQKNKRTQEEMEEMETYVKNTPIYRAESITEGEIMKAERNYFAKTKAEITTTAEVTAEVTAPAEAPAEVTAPAEAPAETKTKTKITK